MNPTTHPEIMLHMPQHVFEALKEEAYTRGYTDGYHEGWSDQQKGNEPCPSPEK